MKKKKKKRKVIREEPKLKFDWDGRVRYCTSPNGNRFPYAKRTKKFPNESEMTQVWRLQLKTKDDVDLEAVLRSQEEKKSWMGRAISTLGNLWKNAVFTVVSKNKQTVGRVYKVKEDKVVFTKTDEEGKFSLPPDTKVVRGNAFYVEPQPIKKILFPINPKGAQNKERYETEHRRKVKRDRFGAKIGSESAKINAVLGEKPKTSSTIKKEAQTTRNVTSHLATLVKRGIVKKFVGKKTGRILYKLKEKQ